MLPVLEFDYLCTHVVPSSGITLYRLKTNPYRFGTNARQF